MRGWQIGLILAVAAIGCRDVNDNGVAAALLEAVEAQEAGDTSHAYEAYTRAAHLSATNFTAQMGRTLTAYELGKPEEAFSAATAARVADPDSCEAVLAEGRAAYLTKDYALARRDFDAVSHARQLPAALRAQGYLGRAVTDFADGRLDAARIGLWRAMRADRVHAAAAWYHLGRMSRDIYHFDAAALEQFEMYSRMAVPPDARARDVVQKTLPSLREAIQVAAASKSGAGQRNPGKSAKLLAEGETALGKRQMKVARDRFQKAYAADVLSYPAAWQYAQLLAQDKGAAVDTEKTLKVFSDALDANPSASTAALAAARYALQNKRYEKAEKFLSRLLAYNPESKSALDLYIETLRKTGKNKAAAEYQAYRKEL